MLLVTPQTTKPGPLNSRYQDSSLAETLTGGKK
jgi:hypothetical protein